MSTNLSQWAESVINMDYKGFMMTMALLPSDIVTVFQRRLEDTCKDFAENDSIDEHVFVADQSITMAKESSLRLILALREIERAGNPTCIEDSIMEAHELLMTYLDAATEGELQREFTDEDARPSEDPDDYDWALRLLNQTVKVHTAAFGRTDE